MARNLSELFRGQYGNAIIVGPSLAEPDMAFWPQANRHILWGWKRDDGRQSRTVYFSGELSVDSSGVSVGNRFFFYSHRTDARIAGLIYEHFSQAIPKLQMFGERPRVFIERSETPLNTVRFAFGDASAADTDRVSRLLRRRPRRVWNEAEKPRETADVSEALTCFPVDAYLGSGVSYECGLPTLCEVHDFFCLDDHKNGRFTHGESDRLPEWFAYDPVSVITNFCSLAVKALTAQPSRAQVIIASAYNSGRIRQVFSDNVDNMLVKVRVPFERTRGSGVFNERHPAEFKTDTLLVVGVAADRREIIAQARRKRMQVVVVDPCGKVSHGVQHLNYLRSDDLFYRWTADRFFSTLADTSGAL